MKASTASALVAVTWVLMTAACGRPDRTGPPARVLATIEAAGKPVSYALASPDLPGGRTAVEVSPTPGRASFLVLSRTSQLRQAPCATCHMTPLASMRAEGPGPARRAHWSIELAHAPASVMGCATCHAADAAALRLLGGEPVGFDHAYRLCAQCHSRQVADWAGGAHGKRVGGWVPPRVVYGCPECHDPHRPALGPRRPARPPRLSDEVRRP